MKQKIVFTHSVLPTQKELFSFGFAPVKGREISVKNLRWRWNFAKESFLKLQCDYVQQFQQYNMQFCSSKLTFYLHVAALTHKCLSETISFAALWLSSSLIPSDRCLYIEQMFPISVVAWRWICYSTWAFMRGLRLKVVLYENTKWGRLGGSVG